MTINNSEVTVTMPKTHKRRVEKFAKIIRKNTNLGFIESIKAAKNFLHSEFYEANGTVKEPFAYEYGMFENTTSQFFTGKIEYYLESGTKETWEIPTEFYSWKRNALL